MTEDITYQSVRASLLTLLPEPREISMAPDKSAEIFESGDPPEVMVRLTNDEVQVFRCSYVWAGPHELVKNPQLAGSVNWSQTDAGVVYRGLIKKARARRRRTFRTCRYCGGMFGPEHKHSPDVCDGCAEVHLGIIH